MSWDVLWVPPQKLTPAGVDGSEYKWEGRSVAGVVISRCSRLTSLTWLKECSCSR